MGIIMSICLFISHHEWYFINNFSDQGKILHIFLSLTKGNVMTFTREPQKKRYKLVYCIIL